MAIIKLAIPVDTQYISPAELPPRQSFKFPPVDSPGYIVGWGRDKSSLDSTTYNRYLQKNNLTAADLNSTSCRDTDFGYRNNGTDSLYNVNF